MFGFEKRKRKQRVDELIQSQAGALDRFISSNKQKESSNLNEEQEILVNEEQEIVGNEGKENLGNEGQENLGNQEHKEFNEQIDESGHEGMDNDSQNEDMSFERGVRNIDDPSIWDKIDQKFIDFIVERGPLKRDKVNFPMDNAGRRFLCFHYIHRLSNGEKQDGRWLVYSNASDKVFCFCCKLFKQDENETMLATSGLNDWHNLAQRVKSHEASNEHIFGMSKWIKSEIRLRLNETIDKSVEDQIKKDKVHWKGVLERVIEAVKNLLKITWHFAGTTRRFIKRIMGFF
ncbi:uncharacterized protein LOC131317191 [Rhododendron vialii]|uniref:uncharacterized protein LOC131317191 n=1 Tax=Rhododendron vialii TaxID=182163 RepID=UPI00265DA05E|nr:uncharacterized protein LOC131317191 [Rhododendron vialii]